MSTGVGEVQSDIYKGFLLVESGLIVASASDPDCVKTRDLCVFRGLFTIPDLEKTPWRAF